MKKGLITFVLTSTLIGLTGCAGDNNNAGSDNNGGHFGVNNVRNNVRNNDNNGVTGRNVSNQNLRVSTRAANNVERIGEVDQAHVIIRNNDAYVAVRLNNNQGTTGDRAGTGTGNQINTSYNGNGNGNNAGYTQYTGNTGITGNKTNAGTTGRNMNKGTGSITGNNTVARTEGLNGTNTGFGTNGITGTNTNTGNNGMGTNTGNTNTGLNGNNVTGDTTYKEVSTRLEQRIADEVRAADKKIHNVYVSYDNDFYNQMNTYTNDIQNGRNRDGIWNDFTDTVGRFFQ
ncbi:YhcN/YlaJ family sporulation lipoprotein [Neobacillus vireti]|uniref:YhcN/YlaJ family sporulation lipoprotein n=1 Tax=Neobacillus vireti TaxID=220686 RepID=UPI002FFFB430